MKSAHVTRLNLVSNDSANMISYLSVIHFDALSQSENKLFKKINMKSKRGPSAALGSFHFHNNVLNVNFYICGRNLVLLFAHMIANVARNVMMQ